MHLKTFFVGTTLVLFNPKLAKKWREREGERERDRK
jgi:hypothetical protein